jgi:hypothetical protein
VAEPCGVALGAVADADVSLSVGVISAGALGIAANVPACDWVGAAAGGGVAGEAGTRCRTPAKLHASSATAATLNDRRWRAR